MEQKCKKCSIPADYICICIEKHLCDNCLINHVSHSKGTLHRPVSLAHPLLTLLMESQDAHLPSSDAVTDQIEKLTAFKQKSILMIENKIKQLLEQNEKNSLRKSINKTNDTCNEFKILTDPNSRASPALDAKSVDRSQSLKREDLSPERTEVKLTASVAIVPSEFHYKIVVDGDDGVGKSTLMANFRKKYMNGQNKVANDKASGVIRGESNSYYIDIWDLSGKDKYMSLSKMCLFKAVGAIVLFDLTNEVSFWTVEKRLQVIMEEADVMSVVALVGNKLDLCVKYPKKRFISYDKGCQMAAEKGMIYDEICANNVQHIHELFRRIAKEIHSRRIATRSANLHNSFARSGFNNSFV